MDFIQVIAEINYWAVVVAALSAFVVGWMWYGPLFGKSWMELNGFTDRDSLLFRIDSYCFTVTSTRFLLGCNNDI